MFFEPRFADPETPRVVCVPAYDRREDLILRTLRSVAKNTTADTIIVVFSARRMDEFDGTGGTSHRFSWCLNDNPASPGCVLDHVRVNYSNHDILLVHPGIEVPYGWDIRLALAAAQDKRIASVSPLCDISPLFALLDNHSSQRESWEALDVLAYTLGQRRVFELPDVLWPCVYMRGSALEQAQDLGLMGDTEWGSFCQNLARIFNQHGLFNVGCDHVYVVDHHPEHPRLLNDLSALAEAALINRAHPLTGLRWSVNEALARDGVNSPAPIVRKPVQLHVAHSWGGGLGRWVQDFCDTDAERINLVLRSIGTWGAFGQRIALYPSYRMDTPLRYWDLEFPIRSTAITHLQYRAIVQEIIDDFGVEVIIISSLIGHTLDLLDTGIKTLFVAHDYYPFCPAIYIFFDDICTHCEQERLSRCFAENEQNRFFINMDHSEWMGIRRRFIELAKDPAIHFIAPSPSVPRHLTTLVPALANRDFDIIEHGIGLNFDNKSVHEEKRSRQDKLRIVVLGSLAPQKGQKLLAACYEELTQLAELYLLGCGEEGVGFKGRSGVHWIPHYDHADLAAIMAQIRPDLGLLLSIWPETFSYTLSELWALGIPPLATRVGSFADRIAEDATGFLCQPTALDVVAKVAWIDANRDRLDRVRRELTTWRQPTLKEMVAAYHALTPLAEFSARGYFSRSFEPPPLDPGRANALMVDPQVRFTTVMREFSQYVLEKLSVSPRLFPWQKKLLIPLLKTSFRFANSLADRKQIRFSGSKRE